MQDLLHNFINNPENAENNYRLGLHYEGLGQLASAVSFFIRTVERSSNTLLQYECLLRAAKCFELQGTRKFTVKGLLQHAVSLLPKRPEAYYYLSRILEGERYGDGRWFDSYTYASIGIVTADHTTNTILDYPGFYALLFQKGVAAWWCGLCDESRDIMLELHTRHNLDEKHKKAVLNNLTRLNGFSSVKLEQYDKSKSLKFTFKGSETLERNYSEAFQDLFVLYLLDGKSDGTYIEIGAGHPTYGNNTFILESLGWTGVSLDIEPSLVAQYNSVRANKCIQADATTFDYSIYLNIDYLQVDCDPAETSLQTLHKVLEDGIRPSIITFEHDAYIGPSDIVRNSSRQLLTSLGYELVVGNIAPDNYRYYEDWWVLPNKIDKNKINAIKQQASLCVPAKDLMLL